MDRPTGIRRVLPAGLAVVLAGCAASGPHHVPQSTPYLVDVPVPQGFRLASRRSRDVMAGPHRIVDHEYHGSGETLDLRAFYNDQMPLGGWEPGVVQNDNGTYTLRFAKGNEDCSIRIRPRLWGVAGAAIDVSIRPRGSETRRALADDTDRGAPTRVPH